MRFQIQITNFDSKWIKNGSVSCRLVVPCSSTQIFSPHMFSVGSGWKSSVTRALSGSLAVSIEGFAPEEAKPPGSEALTCARSRASHSSFHTHFNFQPRAPRGFRASKWASQQQICLRVSCGGRQGVLFMSKETLLPQQDVKKIRVLRLQPASQRCHNCKKQSSSP